MSDRLDENNLPPQWVERYSKRYSSKKYYFNMKTGERTWKHPTLSDFAGAVNRNKTVKSSDKKTKNKMEKRKNKIKEIKTIDKKENVSMKAKVSSKPIILSSGEKPNFTVTKKTSISSKLQSSIPTNETKKRKRPDEFNDVEMIDLTISDNQNSIETSPDGYLKPTKQCKLEPSTSNADVAVNDELKKSVIVVDTNILMASRSLSVLKYFITNFENSRSKTCHLFVVIPWTVLQELDHLKKSKQKAITAISFLNQQFSKRLKCIRGQTIFEAAMIIEGFSSSCNDDDILHCCFAMQKSNPNHDVVLATADKNLKNKALVNNLGCLNDLDTLLKVKFTGDEKTVDVEVDTEYEVNPSSEEVQRLMKESLLDKLTFHLKSCLSEILKQEMIRIYDNLWLEIVAVRPPWNLRDVFKCYKKHWMAIFVPLAIPRVARTFLERLNEFFTHAQQSYRNVDICDYSHCAVVFLSTLQNYGKYNAPVNIDIAEIKGIHTSLIKSKLDVNLNTPGPSLAHDSGMEDNVEEQQQSMHDNGIAVFWRCLDKIWTAILCHCGIVFQSLSFLPASCRMSPEMKQLLTSNYDNVPAKEVSVRSLPLISEVMNKLIECLDRFINASSTEVNVALIDLLQCLWMITRGFDIETNMSCLQDVESLQRLLVVDNTTSERINFGYRQLLNAYHTVEDCKQYFQIM